MSESTAIGVKQCCNRCDTVCTVLHNQTNLTACPECGGASFTMIGAVYRATPPASEDHE